jgi:gliding motility-associated protein GldC
MKSSEIRLLVELDEKNVPEKLFWRATDAGHEQLQETRSFSLAIWDSKERESLRIDLWTKDMPVEEMKHFYIDALAGMAQSLRNATNDEFMAAEMEDLCVKLTERLKKEMQQS